MATTTTKTPVRRPKSTPTTKHVDGATTLEYLQQAIEDIDHARQHASRELRSNLDAAMERMSDIASGLRKRAEDEAADWQMMLEHTTEEMRRDLGGRAVRAQQTPDALAELAAAIKKRKAQLPD